MTSNDERDEATMTDSEIREFEKWYDGHYKDKYTAWNEDIQRGALDGWQAALASLPRVTEELSEEGAEMIYDAMVWAAKTVGGYNEVPWQNGGNSNAQNKARETLRAILSRFPQLKKE